MAGTVRTGSHQNILNSDGQRHTVQNVLTIFTLVVGLIAFVLGLIVRNTHAGAAVHITATATGLAAAWRRSRSSSRPSPPMATTRSG